MASVTFFSAFTRPSIIHQTLPGKPKFTEKDIKDLSGKVYIVTGSNTGVGKELARILYGANAAVYMACRTESKARDAIKDIQSAAPESKGRLEFLQLDLSDLKTIQPAAEAFTSKESKLHVLFNNAGVMVPPPDKKTAQGYDMQLGTNCLGPVLFTNLVTGTLKATAQQEPPGTVRVVWVSSSAAEIYSGKNGVNMDEVRNKETYGQGSAPMDLYGNSKAGNYFHSVEYARRHKDDGIVSVALNPGNLDSDLYRSVKDQSGVTKWVLSILKGYMVYPQVNGAYTELWAGLSEEVTLEKSGSWIGPWGKFYDIRHDLADAGKPIDQGGQGVATAFWDWSVQQTKAFQGQSAHL